MNSSLDTNIILRYIWKDIPSQREKAIALMDDETQTFCISDMVVSEIVYNLQSSHLRRSTIVNILSEIFEKKNIEADPFIRDTVLPYYADHPALSFTDCYAAFDAERTHAEPLWTFDHKLAHQHPSTKHLS